MDKDSIETLVARLEAAGIQCWTDGSDFHRDDGPAILYPDGREEWYRSGRRHRDDGPAICGGAVEAWYRDGVRHRDDGPAYVDCVGRREWYSNGQLHRVDGPAVVDPAADNEWYLDGEPVSPLDDRMIGSDNLSSASLSDTFF